MRIGRIGHASLTFEHGDQLLLMDPILVDPFEAGSCTFEPPVTLDVAALRDRCTAVVLSHEHFDHFCPRSLALLNRRVKVFYPAGCELIELALERLGFANRQPLHPWRSVDIGDLKLTPTPSLTSFPELGFVVRAGDRTVWNQVDTNVDEQVIGFLRAAYGSPDLLIAPYQPLIEEPLGEDGLGSAFPHAQYGHLLLNVWNTKARCVVPGSCGLRLTRDWVNHRMFPVSELQFAADLRRVEPHLQVLFLPHGGAITVAEQISVEPQALAYAKASRDADPSATDWRPDLGVPALVDENRRRHPLETLRAEVEVYLNDELLPGLTAQTVWRERLGRIGALWRLEVIYPDGSRLRHELDFAHLPLRWSPPDPRRFASIQTSVTASGLVGVRRGELSRYAFLYNELRVATRLFETHRLGVSQAGDSGDEPLTLLLKQTTDRRFVERELDEILRTAAR